MSNDHQGDALKELKDTILDLPQQLTGRLWEAQSRDEVEAILTDACLLAVIDYLDRLSPSLARQAWTVEPSPSVDNA